MENWIILNKLILLIYVSVLLVKGNFDYPCSNYIVIISLLFYVIINVSKSLISNNRYKLIFLSISILELLICIFFVTPIFFILLPLNFFEIFIGKIKLIFILFVLLISIFIINKHFIVCEYSFASLFSLVAYIKNSPFK